MKVKSIQAAHRQARQHSSGNSDVTTELGSGWSWSAGWNPNIGVQVRLAVIRHPLLTMPSLQWLDNSILETNTDANYNCDIHYYDQFYGQYRFIAFVGNVHGTSHSLACLPFGVGPTCLLRPSCQPASESVLRLAS